MSGAAQMKRLQGTVVSSAEVRRRWLGLGMLIVSAACVGIAIVLDGVTGRVVNGIGAAGWVSSAGVLCWQLRRTSGFGGRFALAAVLAIGIAAIVRPNDLIAALVGFGIVGGIMAAFAAMSPIAWAALVAAMYLPAHIAIAISRSLLRGDVQVRVDPPPTAAIVPLVIVVSAVTSGAAVGWWKRRQD